MLTQIISLWKRRFVLSDLLTKLTEVPIYFLPLATLLLGIIGSVHCMGMCGPLVLAFARSKKENLLYQIGRLSGYFFLALGLSTLGVGFKKVVNTGLIMDISIYLLAIFIFLYGVNILLKGKLDFSKKGRWGHLFESFYLKVKPFIEDSQFLLGALSIFLPCGLLYGVLAIILVSGNQFIAIASVFSFWLGTLPGLFAAPFALGRIGKFLKFQSTKLSSLTFMAIGLITIYLRYQASIEGTCQHCH